MMLTGMRVLKIVPKCAEGYLLLWVLKIVPTSGVCGASLPVVVGVKIVPVTKVFRELFTRMRVLKIVPTVT